MKKATSSTRKSGFTLIEIVIVVAIIGLLAAIAVPGFQRARANSIEATKTANVKVVMNAYEMWANDNPDAVGTETVDLDTLQYIKGGLATVKISGVTWGGVPADAAAWSIVSPAQLKALMYP